MFSEQRMRPVFLPGAYLLRSKLRQVGTGKKQPSFLRLASRQGKPGKPLTPRDWIHLHRIILKAHISQIVLINLAKYPCYRIFSANAKPRRLEICDVFTIPEDRDFYSANAKPRRGWQWQRNLRPLTLPICNFQSITLAMCL